MDELIELFDFLTGEANQPFSGWDFSHITRTERMVDAPLSWSYASKVLARFKHIESMLDLGTGGGEFLFALRPLPPHTCATEGYSPNVPIARQRLEPLGVKVYEFSDENHLPFEDNQFDLIIDKHESYAPREVLRILKPGCQFITQQVGGSNYGELNRMLGADEYQFAFWTLDYAVQELEAAGWHIIEQQEDTPITRFYDIGAIVYYLKAVPWQVPDFSLEKYLHKLAEIQDTIQAQGYIDIHYHRFLIVAQKVR